MGFKEFALRMYPFWILGIFIIISVLNSGQKNLLRIEKSAIMKWIKFLSIVTLIRFLICKFLIGSYISSSMHGASILPCTAAFTVFWEDAVHGLPLLILRKLIGVNKWTIPLHILLTSIFMLEFGLGHLYQGPHIAFLLSFYIPYSINIAKRRGFGTVMVGHMLYDFFTLFFIKILTYL